MVLSSQQLNPRGLVIGAARRFESVKPVEMAAILSPSDKVYLVLKRTLVGTTVLLAVKPTARDAETFAGYERQRGARDVRVESFR